MRLLLLSTLFIAGTAFGQLKQKMADEYYSLMEYSKCVEMYDELAEKCISGSKNGNWSNVEKAAISHYKLYQMDRSVYYFEQLNKVNKLTEADRELFIQALRFEAKYDDARSLIQESNSLHPSNPFFKRLFDQRYEFDRLFLDSARFVIAKTGIESTYGDFCPTYYQNGLVYATKSKNAEFLGGKYGWDDAYFVSLLHTSFVGEDSTISNGDLLKDKFLSKAHDGPVDFNDDESMMVITKNRQEKKQGKQIVTLGLYFANKIEDKWTALEAFPYNSKEYNVGHGCFTNAGKTLYFASDMPGGQGGSDIYVSHLSNGKWSKPENLGPTINTEKNELFPFVENEMLVFSSNGHYGLGGLDLFEIDLKTKSSVRNLGFPINSSSDDFGYIAQNEHRKGYFSSNREQTTDKIYSFVRKPINIVLDVMVFEQYKEKELIYNQPFKFTNDLTNEVQEYFTDDKGKLSLLVRPNEKYTLTTEKEYFVLSNPSHLSTEGFNNDTTVQRELILLPTKITVALRILEKGTRKPLDLATTTVTDYAISKDTSLITNENGLVTLIVDRNKTYWAHASKKGYIAAEKAFTTSNQDGKIIELELELPLIKKGEKFKLENIFYDLNKATLRPESMAALDKLADFILKNNLKIELSAHTDSRGSASYNQKLSQARAQSCVTYLLSKGVNKSQIVAKGYGESRLVNKCKDGVKCTEDEHQENRRTEVKILEVN